MNYSERQQTTNATPCYIDNINNYNCHTYSSIYPPVFSAVNPEIFKFATPHGMHTLVNPKQKFQCRYGNGGYKKLNKTGCDTLCTLPRSVPASNDNSLLWRSDDYTKGSFFNNIDYQNLI